MADKPHVVGRGSGLRPPNRFGEIHAELDLEQVEHDAEYLATLAKVPTTYLPDDSRSIISENDSPDLFFRYSLNPYRGCLHGCSYCYARPTHEYLGLNAGIARQNFAQEAPHHGRVVNNENPNLRHAILW